MEMVCSFGPMTSETLQRSLSHYKIHLEYGRSLYVNLMKPLNDNNNSKLLNPPSEEGLRLLF